MIGAILFAFSVLAVSLGVSGFAIVSARGGLYRGPLTPWLVVTAIGMAGLMVTL